MPDGCTSQIQEKVGSSSGSTRTHASAPLKLPSPSWPVPELRFSPLGADITLVVLHQDRSGHCTLHPEEASLLRGNVAKKRRNDFVLGRAAARLALIGAGIRNPSPVLQGSGREPVWPQKIVGSITHCGPWAIAAVANNKSVEAVGIDLEDAQDVPHGEIAGTVCNDSEREWVFASGDNQLKLAMIFSAKEAIYKALYPLCKKFFDFHAVELTWFPQSNQFRGILLVDLSSTLPKGYRFKVGCQKRATFVFTHAIVTERALVSENVQGFSAT